MKRIASLLWVLLVSPAFAESPGVERAASYRHALERAAATGKDIVVFQRGSDWNACSESLYRNVWSSAAFADALGEGFILVAIDYPEIVGGRAVYGRCTAERCGLVGYTDTPIGSVAPMRLEALAKAEPPASEIVGVTGESGATFQKRDDGAFRVAPDAPNPATDTLTLNLRPARAGRVLRLDFPTDETLPAHGPGRASNGNAVIGEVVAAVDGGAIRATLAWAGNNAGNNFGPWTVVDGVSDKADEGWNLQGGTRQRRTLLVMLEREAPAGAELKVTLVCRSQWGQHVPGCVRAAVIADAQVAADVAAVAEAQAMQHENRGFTWASWGEIPRVAMLDAQGRPIAADSSLRIGLTSAALADRVKAMRVKRLERDMHWAKAEKATGPAKAELLRRGLDALDVGRDPEFGRNNGWGGGNNGPYAPIHQAMREADPKDESGAIRWLGFSMGAWGAIAWAPENAWWKKLDGKPEPTDADYAEAEACIDRELADPRNRLLETDHIQHIMKARYDLYLRKYKNDRTHEKVLEVQRKIAAVDPASFWGVGAIGYVGMFRRSDDPFVCYGWDGNHQIKPGVNAWTLADAWMQIDHAGPYNLRMTYQKGESTFTVRRIAVMDGEREIAVATPAPGANQIGPGSRSLVIPFRVATLPADRRCTLRVEYEAAAGAIDNVGGFDIEPLLDED